MISLVTPPLAVMASFDDRGGGAAHSPKYSLAFGAHELEVSMPEKTVEVPAL